jgi:hypothetical protein
MSDAERTEFLEVYAGHKSEIFDKRRVPESHYQVDVTVLRKACQVFRSDLFRLEI